MLSGESRPLEILAELEFENARKAQGHKNAAVMRVL